MEIKVSLNGKYPRSEDLIKATRDFERGRVSKDKVEEEFRKDYSSVFSLQNGWDLISDGLLIWDDIIRPLSKFIKGTDVDGLVRYFETNTFIRRLKFSGSKVDVSEKDIDVFFKGGNLAVLPGPYTVRVFSEGLGIYDIGKVMAEIMEFLTRKNYEMFFLQEPALPFYPDKSILPEVEKAIGYIKSKVSGKVIINTYFSPINDVLDFLLNTDADGIGVDFMFNDIDFIRSRWNRDKGLVAGIVDTTNSLVEEIGVLLGTVRKICDMDIPFVVFTGSADFELLPRVIADKKVDVLKKIKEESNG